MSDGDLRRYRNQRSGEPLGHDGPVGYPDRCRGMRVHIIPIVTVPIILNELDHQLVNFPEPDDTTAQRSNDIDSARIPNRPR